MNLAKIKNNLKLYNHLWEHAKDNMFRILFFAIAAMILGQGIPDMYFKYFDHTVYYFIKNPILVEGITHHPGENVIVEINRESLVDTTAISVTELVLYKDNMEVQHFKRDLAITIGKETIHAVFTLPQDLKEGVYYYRGVVNYKIRGIDKNTPFFTDQFEVTK